MINRAVRATNGEIMQNQIAYQSYMKAANSVRLRADYVKRYRRGNSTSRPSNIRTAMSIPE